MEKMKLFKNLIKSLYSYLNYSKSYLEYLTECKPSDSLKDMIELVNTTITKIELKMPDFIDDNDKRIECKITVDNFKKIVYDFCILSVFVAELYKDNNDCEFTLPSFNDPSSISIHKLDFITLSCGDRKLSIPIWVLVEPMSFTYNIRVIDEMGDSLPKQIMTSRYITQICGRLLESAVANHNYNIDLPEEAIDILAASSLKRVFNYVRYTGEAYSCENFYYRVDIDPDDDDFSEILPSIITEMKDSEFIKAIAEIDSNYKKILSINPKKGDENIISDSNIQSLYNSLERIRRQNKTDTINIFRLNNRFNCYFHDEVISPTKFLQYLTGKKYKLPQYCQMGEMFDIMKAEGFDYLLDYRMDEMDEIFFKNDAVVLIHSYETSWSDQSNPHDLYLWVELPDTDPDIIRDKFSKLDD